MSKNKAVRVCECHVGDGAGGRGGAPLQACLSPVPT